MDIPVYLIAGFLDAGKTNFINGILKDGFAAEDKTLLICCEEGEEEYDPHGLFNVFTYTVEDQAELTPELFKKLEKQYRPKQVIIEYNGCNEQLRTQLRSKNLRMANRRADIYLENEDGTSEEYVTEDMMPFDLSSGHLEVADEDYGIWYVDLMDHPERYEGVSVTFKALMCHSKKFKGVDCPGRFAMVCCENDMQFLALVCKGQGMDRFKNRDWVKIRATVKKEQCEAYQGEGPVLYVERISACQKPDPGTVSF